MAAFLIFQQQRFQMILTARIKEIERLVKNHKLRRRQQGGCNTDLLLITGRKLSDIFLPAENLVTEKGPVIFQKPLNILLLYAVCFGNKGKVLPRRKEIDEETFFQISGNILFPRFVKMRDALCGLAVFSVSWHGGIIHYIEKHLAAICLDEIQDKTEQCRFPCTVITDKADDFTRRKAEFGDKDCRLIPEFLYQLTNGYFDHDSS